MCFGVLLGEVVVECVQIVEVVIEGVFQVLVVVGQDGVCVVDGLQDEFVGVGFFGLFVYQQEVVFDFDVQVVQVVVLVCVGDVVGVDGFGLGLGQGCWFDVFVEVGGLVVVVGYQDLVLVVVDYVQL